MLQRTATLSRRRRTPLHLLLSNNPCIPASRLLTTAPSTTAGDSITLRGALLNATLSTSKFVAGVLSSSPALISDAAHSLSDLLTDAATYYTHRAAREPPDWGHPYGHGKYEALGSLAVSAVLVSTGAGVALNAVGHLTSTDHSGLDVVGVLGYEWTMGVAFASIVAKELMYRETLKVGKATKSSVLIGETAPRYERSEFLSARVLVSPSFAPSLFFRSSHTLTHGFLPSSPASSLTHQRTPTTTVPTPSPPS